MIRSVATVVLMLAVVPVISAAASVSATGPGVLPPRLEARYQHLTENLRCPVCQNEPIATSQSQIAAALREIVRQRLVSGESDKQIMDYMISRYGLFAVYKPPVEWGTFFLWFGPLILFLIGAFVAGRSLQRRRSLLRHSDAER